MTIMQSVRNGQSHVSLPSTSFADSGYIARVGESVGLGISGLSSDAVDCVSDNVMYVLRHLIRNSAMFAVHSGRICLLPEDVDSALQYERRKPQFGFKSEDSVPLRLVGSGGRDVYVEEGREVELAPIYTAAPPKIPAHSVLRAHWLAIDGEQPAVPENPIPSQPEDESAVDKEAAPAEEMQEESTRLLNLLKGNKKSELVNVKTVTTHMLSLEQQVFFKEVTEAIMGSDDHKRTEALHSLRTDAGIQPMVGRFAVTVSEGVKCNIVQHNLAFLIYLMRIVQSLANNPNISLDKFLQDFLPSIMSCVLSRQLCARPEADNHWALREFSAKLLAELCRKYNVLEVQSRITRVLTRVWADESASIATLYGSLFTLNELGLETIQSVVVPRTVHLYDRLHLASADRNQIEDKVAADRLLSFLTKVLINYVRVQRPPHLREFTDYKKHLGGFADAVYKVVATDVPVPHIISTPQRPISKVQLAPAHASPRVYPTSMQPAGVPRSVPRPAGNYMPVNSPRVRYTASPAQIRRPAPPGGVPPQHRPQ